MEKPNQRKISALPDSNTRKNVENAHLPSLSEKLVQFDWSVPAHGDSVSSLQYIHEPASILSASHDHTVRIWGVKGDEKESGLDLYCKNYEESKSTLNGYSIST